MTKDGHKHVTQMDAIELTDLVVRLHERFQTLKHSTAVLQGLASWGLKGSGEYWARTVDRHIAEIDELLEVAE